MEIHLRSHVQTKGIRRISCQSAVSIRMSHPFKMVAFMDGADRKDTWMLGGMCGNGIRMASTGTCNTRMVVTRTSLPTDVYIMALTTSDDT